MTPEQFKKIIHQHSTPIYRQAMLMIKNEEDARDVLQEIIIKLWQKNELLNEIRNLGGFIYTLTRNYCLDLIKKKKFQLHNDTNKFSELEADSDPLKLLEDKSTNQLIFDAIDKLPSLQKEIIILRDVNELEYEEISDRLNMHTGAVRTNLSRARKFVKESLLRHYDTERRKIDVAGQ